MLDSHLPRPASPRDTIPNAPPVVVVAEDDDLLRAVVCDLLAHQGFLVREVRDRVSLEAELMNEDAGAVIADVYLADGHCGDLVATLAAGVAPPHLVLMSAYSDADTIANEHGLDLLRKPFGLRELLDAVLVAFPDSPRVLEPEWPDTPPPTVDEDQEPEPEAETQEQAEPARIFRVALSRTPEDAVIAARRACAPPEVALRADGFAFARYDGQSLVRFQSLEDLLRRFAIAAEELIELAD